MLVVRLAFWLYFQCRGPLHIDNMSVLKYEYSLVCNGKISSGIVEAPVRFKRLPFIVLANCASRPSNSIGPIPDERENGINKIQIRRFLPEFRPIPLKNPSIWHDFWVQHLTVLDHYSTDDEHLIAWHLIHVQKNNNMNDFSQVQMTWCGIRPFSWPFPSVTRYHVDFLWTGRPLGALRPMLPGCGPSSPTQTAPNKPKSPNISEWDWEWSNTVFYPTQYRTNYKHKKKEDFSHFQECFSTHPA